LPAETQNTPPSAVFGPRSAGVLDYPVAEVVAAVQPDRRLVAQRHRHHVGVVLARDLVHQVRETVRQRRRENEVRPGGHFGDDLGTGRPVSLRRVEALTVPDRPDHLVGDLALAVVELEVDDGDGDVGSRQPEVLQSVRVGRADALRGRVGLRVRPLLDPSDARPGREVRDPVGPHRRVDHVAVVRIDGATGGRHRPGGAVRLAGDCVYQYGQVVVGADGSPPPVGVEGYPFCEGIGDYGRLATTHRHSLFTARKKPFRPLSFPGSDRDHLNRNVSRFRGAKVRML
jgi:hypothetical protein